MLKEPSPVHYQKTNKILPWPLGTKVRVEACWAHKVLGKSSVQLLGPVRLFPRPWTAAHQACLSITNSWNLLKLMSIELVMPSNHLILCHPLLLLPSIFAFKDKKRKRKPFSHVENTLMKTSNSRPYCHTIPHPVTGEQGHFTEGMRQ